MASRGSREEAIARIGELASEPSGRTTFVGIDGPGAAGKSTLARDAATHAAAIGHRVVSVVAVDDFSGPSVREWDWERFAAQVADPLLAGRAARYQAWNWDDDQPGDWRDLLPGGVVIVEGVSATRREVRLPWSLAIWMDAPRELRLARAIARDGSAMLAIWREEWMPSEENYIAAQRPDERADLIVDGF